MSRKRKLGFLSSIHFKIPLVIILVLLLGLQLVGAYFIRNLEKEMLRTFDDQMSVQIGFLEDSVRPVIQEKEGNEADKKAQLINSLRRFNVSNVLDTVVVNANGQILDLLILLIKAMLGNRRQIPLFVQFFITI